MANIKFGTDGWRAVIGEDFNAENVTAVAKAIAKYVYENFGASKKIIIGYDPRNMADKFSIQAAEILCGLGFTVFYADKVVPTPVLAYNAKYLNACAVMFTASHNPPEYLGIKFIPDYAAPATTEITDAIVNNIGLPFEKFKRGSIVKYDFSRAYFEHIKQIIDFEKLRTLKTNVIFDGLYSAAIGYFDKLMEEEKIPFKGLHMYHDVNFGGGMPEPKPEYLQELIQSVEAADNAVGFANDGDGDRFGVINEKGEYVSPNEIIAILLMHLKNNKNYQGPLVKTVGASLLLDKIAAKLNVKVIETAVGFKHVGAAMRKFNPVIGGEESGGLSIQGHIPEKDGILANLLIMEAMAYANKPLFELQNDINNLAGCKFYNGRIDIRLENNSEHILEKYKNLKEISGLKVKSIDTKDGIKYYLEDGTSRVLIRPSGTEPLLRIYFESDSTKKLESMKNCFSI